MGSTARRLIRGFGLGGGEMGLSLWRLGFIRIEGGERVELALLD